MEVREVICQQNGYAIIDRGNALKEIALVTGYDSEKKEWDATCCYYCYECYNGSLEAPVTKLKALQLCINAMRLRTEENYISTYRMEEIATKCMHCLLEENREMAMDFFASELDLEDYEIEYFGIEEEE